MNYISNAFSPNMVGDDVCVRFKVITKDEFVRAGEYSYSCIGHPEIADHFGLEYNRQSIALLPGDVLYIVTPGPRPKGECYNFIPEVKGWIYRKCTVVASDE